MPYNLPVRRWAQELHEFTKRNAGRITVLQHSDSGEYQDQERGLPFRGVAYDGQDDRVAIMLGELSGTERHLTRSISHPWQIELLSAPTGRDLALRINRADGRTVLRFFDNYS